jgi:peptidoglycan/LPS O-acetylase OafA/YrhL
MSALRIHEDHAPGGLAQDAASRQSAALAEAAADGNPEGMPRACETRDRLKGYIPTLDGWRAIAIVGVLIYHSTTALFYPAGPYPSYDALRIIQTGQKGVDIFFAISGFLICTRLLQEHRQFGSISLRAFYIRRAFRILPPYFLYLAVLAAIAFTGILVVETREWWGCLFFLRNYIGATASHGWYTGHFWSLAVEEHFYLFWPMLLVAIGSRRARPVVVLLALLVPAWSLLQAHWQWIATPGHDSARTDLRIDGLFWGCWAALLMDVPVYRSWATRILKPWVWWAVAVFIVCLARYRPPLEGYIESALWPWLLLGTVLHPSRPASRLLELAPVRWVGRLSYSLYIWQQLFLMGSWRQERPFPLGPWQELPLSIVAAFACAAASYYVVERPLLRIGQRLARSTSEGRRSTPRRSSPQELAPCPAAAQ